MAMSRTVATHISKSTIPIMGVGGGRSVSDVVGDLDRQLRVLLAQAREKVAALEEAEAARVKAFEREIAPLRQRVNALQTMLAAPETHGGQAMLPLAPNGLARDHRGVHPAWREQSPSRLPPSQEWWNRMLRNLNQLDSLMLIAEQHGGAFRVVDAKEILIDAKKITGNPANAYGHLYKLLKDSPRFEKIERGTWRLLPEGTIGVRKEEGDEGKTIDLA